MSHAVVEQPAVGRQRAPPPASAGARQVLRGPGHTPSVPWLSGGTRGGAIPEEPPREQRQQRASPERNNSLGVAQRALALSAEHWDSSAKLPVDSKPFFCLTPRCRRTVYYFNRAGTCGVEQNKSVANVL